MVLPIPGTPHDFETFKQAQGLGDYLSLKRRGRRIVRLCSPDEAAGALRTLVAALRAARAVSAACAGHALRTVPEAPQRASHQCAGVSGPPCAAQAPLLRFGSNHRPILSRRSSTAPS